MMLHNLFRVFLYTVRALSNAASVRIGHLLGAHRPDKIKTCIHATCILGLAIATTNVTLMFTFRNAIANHFSHETNVIEAAIDLMPIACLSHFFTVSAAFCLFCIPHWWSLQGIGSIFSGTLNAFGKQPVVCSVNLVSYYIIGVPLGFYLGRTMGISLNGIWAGFAIAAVLKATWEAIILANMDWELECRRTSRRISEQELPWYDHCKSFINLPCQNIGLVTAFYPSSLDTHLSIYTTCSYSPPKLPIPGSINSVSLDSTGSIIDVTIFTRGNAFLITDTPTGADKNTVKIIWFYQNYLI